VDTWKLIKNSLNTKLEETNIKCQKINLSDLTFYSAST